MTIESLSIERMHSCVQQPWKFIGTKESVYIRRVQLPQDWFCTPTWPPFHCFGTPIWLPWRHVHTLFCTPLQHQNKWVYSLDSSASESKQKTKLNRLPLEASTKNTRNLIKIVLIVTKIPSEYFRLYTLKWRLLHSFYKFKRFSVLVQFSLDTKYRAPEELSFLNLLLQTSTLL